MSGPDARRPDATAPVRVLVADDDALVRSALALLLGGAEGVELVGEVADGAEVPEAVDRLRPDVVLMDIRMPRTDGIAATERLRARGPGAPHVVVLTTFSADDQVMRALRAGAGGFLLKDTPPQEIVEAVRRVADGEAMLSPAVTRSVIDRVVALDPPDGPADPRRARAEALFARLSDREREVALALGHGKANAEIATELYMSVATVKAHVSRLLAKLEVDNRVQVAILAHEAGLT